MQSFLYLCMYTLHSICCIKLKIKAIIYYFTQQNKSATAVIVVVVTNILI